MPELARIRSALEHADTELAQDIALALSIATRSLGLSIGIVSRIDGTEYTVEHAVSPGDVLAAGTTFEVGETYCSLVLESLDIVSIDEMGRSSHRGHPAYKTQGLESYIGVPLRHEGQVWGTLNFSSPTRRPDDYTDTERGLVRLVASWVERTLERSRQLREILRAAEAQGHAGRKAHVMFEYAPEGVVVHRRGIVEQVNPAAQLLVRTSNPDRDVIGKSILDFMPRPADREAIVERLQSMARGLPSGPPVEILLSRMDGTHAVAEVVGMPLPEPGLAVTFLRDLTERREAQRRLLQAERLSSVGTLAAGVAHELNNPLAYVSANLQVVLEQLVGLGDDDPIPTVGALRQALTEARQGADRARRIVNDLTTFSRIDDETLDAHDLHVLIEAGLNMASGELKHRALVERRFGDIPRVWVDDARMTQVLVNLFINAAHAMPPGRRSQHRVVVSTHFDDEQDRVVASIRDTGHGIDETVRKRIFDPFFTTKDLGEGTGLGLPVSLNIVRGFGGDLVLRNHVQGGAEALLLLPPSDQSPSIPPEDEPEPPRDVQSGRVLIIDDDPLVARSMQRALAGRHQVEVVHSGLDALARVAETRFDAILCDVMMPEMSGTEVHERLLAMDPAQARRLVFITGGAVGSPGRRSLEHLDHPRLAKPVDIDLLRRTVDQIVQA